MAKVIPFVLPKDHESQPACVQLEVEDLPDWWEDAPEGTKFHFHDIEVVKE